MSYFTIITSVDVGLLQQQEQLISISKGGLIFTYTLLLIV